MTVRSAIGDRLADDPGASFELPQEFARLSVDCLKPAFHCAVEHDIPGGRDHAAPDREVLFDRPALARVLHIPSTELAAIAAGSRLHLDVRADVRRARDVIGLD